MSDDLSRENLRQITSRWFPSDGNRRSFKVIRDTTDFFRVAYGDVVILDQKPYLIRHNAKEGRFGLDEEVKHWVKGAIDLMDRSTKIIKLVFYEKFVAHIGDIAFECFRSPKKEARILNLVADHENFMHGFATEDTQGNTVRIIDLIYGKPLSKYIEDLDLDHHTYFFERFPDILNRFLKCIEAIGFLHANAEKHGDIRRDHIFVDRESSHYRWIDFDFNYRHRENIYGYDLFGLGNVLVFLVGKGDILLPDLKNRGSYILDTLTQADLNIVFNNRVANLKKIYPYIPEALNRVLMHFSRGTNWFYENTTQLLEDLRAYQKSQ